METIHNSASKLAADQGCIQKGMHGNLMAMHTCAFTSAPQMHYFAYANHCTCALGIAKAQHRSNK